MLGVVGIIGSKASWNQLICLYLIGLAQLLRTPLLCLSMGLINHLWDGLAWVFDYLNACDWSYVVRPLVDSVTQLRGAPLAKRLSLGQSSYGWVEHCSSISYHVDIFI